MWPQNRNFDDLGAATINLMIFAKEAKLPVKEFMVIPRRVSRTFMEGAWDRAIKENERELFHTLKYHTMMYYLSENAKIDEGSAYIIMPEYALRGGMLSFLLIAGPGGTIPMEVKRGVTNLVHQCEEQVRKYQKCPGYHKEEIADAKKVCEKLKAQAIEHKVYIKNAEELRTEAKAKAQKKLQKEAETPIISRYIHF